jgi:hypothetical protein
MIVKCKYFELKEQKFMQDGHFISAKQKLLYICTEENMMQFETVDDSEVKRIFWTKEEEVNFLTEVDEDWSDERIQQQQNEINGKWLNN